MKVGIVGSEAAKFTKLGEERAKVAIYDILSRDGITGVVSGHCHLGGIDIWAEEAGTNMALDLFIFPPLQLNWSNGYKPRNVQIATNSDIVYCISVNKLPPDYSGMTFKSCYHCKNYGGNPSNHTKSGGCWTMYQAIKMGKQGKLIIINNE